MGGEPPLAGRLAPPGRQIPLAVFPGEAPPARLLDAPTLVVVVRVVGPALAVHAALESADGLGVGGQLGAQHAPVVACPREGRWRSWRAPDPTRRCRCPAHVWAGDTARKLAPAARRSAGPLH